MKGEHSGFGSDAVEWGFPRMSHGFILLADGASSDVICYPLFHSGPLGILTCLSEGFVSAEVSSGRMVVVNGHQGAFLEEGEVALDPVGFEFFFRDHCNILVVCFSMIHSRRAR